MTLMTTPSTPTSRSSAPGSPARLCALALRQRGRRVALIERGRHPRFAIGESSTPLANLLLEELADRYDLPQHPAVLEVGHLAARASGRRLRPEARLHVPLPSSPASRSPTTTITQRQLLVAASPHDEIADTHWYRPDFDQALVREARSEGAIYLDETRLDAHAATTATGIDARGHAPRRDRPRHGAVRHRRQRPARISAPRARTSVSAPLRWLPPTQGLFTHFDGRRALGSTCTPPTRRRRIRRTTRRCIMCFRAAGSGCCGSTTASPAPARR